MHTQLQTQFWKNRRVLLTGHTGFKGSWLTLLLQRLGAVVTGVSLPPDQSPSLYECLSSWKNLTSVECDIRDPLALQAIVDEVKPQLVIHMAAQALVFDAYHDPVGTIGASILPQMLV